MKTTDIKIDTAYRAKVRYYGQYKVTVLEKGVPMPSRMVHRGRRATARSGVRVRLEEKVVWFSSIQEIGTELVIPSRDVLREWTPEDDQVRAKYVEEKAWQTEITQRLGGAGYAPLEEKWDNDFNLTITGDFEFHGDRLVLSRKLTEELLEKADI